MLELRRWLGRNWRMVAGVALALAAWTLLAVNSGQGGLGF